MPTALAEVLAAAVSTAAVLTAAVLTGAVSSTRVFSAGMGASIRATMDTGLPRTVIIRSTVRPPATDQIWLAILNRAALARDQSPAPPDVVLEEYAIRLVSAEAVHLREMELMLTK